MKRLLACCIVALGTFTGVVFAGECVVSLNIVPETGLPLVEAKLNGRDCTLLFDTGASHTTFDFTFLTNSFPDIVSVNSNKLEKVKVLGNTNVKFAPQLFRADSLSLGEREFGAVPVMTVPLPLSQAMGRPVDGIVGMDIIGRSPILLSLGANRVVFEPESDSGFGPAVKLVDRERTNCPVFKLDFIPSNQTGVMMLDSGSTFTFLEARLGWPKAESLMMKVTDVNSISGMSMQRGQAGELKLSEAVSLAITPMLDNRPCSYLGADALKRYDVLISAENIRFREFKP